MSSFPTKAYRDWPVEHFIDLAKAVLATFPQAFFIPLGDPLTQDRTRQLIQAIPKHATLEACGRLSLRASVALMETLDLYVGVDTGPTHLAGAIGVPMVALYHCAHPGKLLAPISPKAGLSIIEHPLLDGLCTRTTPMSEITVETVLSAALAQLATSRPRSSEYRA